MRKAFFILFMIVISSFSVKAIDLIDLDFTKDSTIWIEKFPGMAWNISGTDFLLDDIDNFSENGFSFKGSFGKFNPGTGVYAQPMDIEDPSKQYIWAFRLANTGNSYIVFPEVQNAGVLTIHCKSGNSAENAVFYIEKLVEGKWIHVRTMVAHPHGNLNYDVVLRQNLNISEPVTLRIYGASMNLHIYSINLKEYDAQLAKNKPLRLIILPDTQTYTVSFPAIFEAQTAWAANNADSISFVLHEGDITNGNKTSQWVVATKALFMMDGNVPYTFVPGNHDIGTNGSSDTRNTTLMNQYLPYSKYSLVPFFGGTFEVNKMDNTWYTFSKGDYKFLILSLEFGPRNKVLDWAKTIIEMHPNYNVIINTHAYMYDDNSRMGENPTTSYNWLPQSYGIGSDTGDEAVNDGQQMWDKLVKLYPNCLFVFSGHMLGAGIGNLVSKGVNGNKVYQFLANYQQGVNGTVNGGNGFLRIIDLDPDNHTLSIKTYSPYIDQYKTDEGQYFFYNDVQYIKDDASGILMPQSKKIKIDIEGKNLRIVNFTDEMITASIYNLQGVKIVKQSGMEVVKIKLSNSGCYIVQANNGKNILTKRIIIQ